MICKKCGAEVADGLKFCTNCGEPLGEPEPMGPEGYRPMPGEHTKKRRAERLLSRFEIERNYLLVYIIGGFVLSFYNTVASIVAARLGETVLIAAHSVLASPVSFINIPIFIITVVFMVIAHQLKGKGGGNFIAMIGAIAALAVELLFVFSCFFFGKQILAMFNTAEAVVEMGISLLRWIGIGMLIFTLIAGALGFLFHWKRFWVYLLTHAGVLVISVGLLLLGGLVFKSQAFLGLTRGMIQAGIVLIPAVGFNVQGGRTLETEMNH